MGIFSGSVVGGIANKMASDVRSNINEGERWHSIAHIGDNIEKQDDWMNTEDEAPNNASNFSDNNQSAINNRRNKMKLQLKLAALDQANLPTHVVEKVIATTQQNLEDAS